MGKESVKKKVLINSKEFLQFWEDMGPFKYALTSEDYPPLLLEPDEWIFSNNIITLLKTLMQYDKKKMKIVKAPFNPANKKILRPQELSSWKINSFPEEWNSLECEAFTPEGHLTRFVIETINKDSDSIEVQDVEDAFFECLETQIENIGYRLLRPLGQFKFAAIKKYLEEWKKDDKEAGLI